MPGPWSSLRPYALRLLRFDHKRMRRLLKALDKAGTGGDRMRVFSRLEWELALHGRLEHDIFYAEYRKACRKDGQRKLFHEATEQHEAMDRMLDDLRDCDAESVRFAGRARALGLALRGHMREEERKLFPQARKVLGRHGLKSIGRAMQDRRRALVRGTAA